MQKKRYQDRRGRSLFIIRMVGRDENGTAIIKADDKAYTCNRDAKKALLAEFDTGHWPLTVAITESTDPMVWQQRFAGLSLAPGTDGALIIARRNDATITRMVKAQPYGRPVVIASLMPLAVVPDVLALAATPDLDTVEGRHLARLLSHPSFPAAKVARLSKTDDFPLRYTFHPALQRYRSRDLYGDAVLLPLKGFYATEDEDGGKTFAKRRKVWDRYGNDLCPMGYHAMKAQPDGIVWLVRFLRAEQATGSEPTHATIHLMHDPAPRMNGRPVDFDSLF